MIAKEIRTQRIKRGISIYEVSRQTGIDRKRIEDIEAGANTTIETLGRLGAVLGFEVTLKWKSK